jgi:hypothetical protein
VTPAYHIDPRNRSISLIDEPLELPANGVAIQGLGIVHSDPMSIMQPGINPWFFEPLGMMLGPAIVTEPVVPEHVIHRLTTWVRATMVINQATLIIPYR